MAVRVITFNFVFKMNILIFSSCLVFVVNAASISDLDLEEWQSFKREYKKVYSVGEEEEHRMKIFLENKKEIEEHNAKYQKGDETFEMAVNQFSDLLSSEVLGSYTGFKPEESEFVRGPTFVPPANVELPDEVNWVKKGAVTPVKDQRNCGSCWAFSATGALEGQNFLKNKKLVSLSEQNLIDCATTGNHRCRGGRANFAFEYVKENNGIDTEVSYPYEAVNGTCRYNPKNRGATDKGFIFIKEGDEDALKAAVASIGPISVSVDITRSFWKYSHGVFVDKKCKNSASSMTHCMLVVGYGTDEKTKLDYWLVKNSWNASWGEEGYIKMARNRRNMCGIATYAVYPLL